MSRYWYFPATLPGLLFGSASPMTDEQFMEMARQALSPSDFAELETCLDISGMGAKEKTYNSRLLADYRAWERAFRNELARLRSRKAGIDEEQYLRQGPCKDEAAAAAQSCFTCQDPLEAELAAEHERWLAVERYSALSSFDLDSIIAYRIKLGIVNRLKNLEKERGILEYSRLYKEIMEKAASRDAYSPGDEE